LTVKELVARFEKLLGKGNGNDRGKDDRGKDELTLVYDAGQGPEAHNYDVLEGALRARRAVLVRYHGRERLVWGPTHSAGRPAGRCCSATRRRP
jgi:hypothetical protein